MNLMMLSAVALVFGAACGEASDSNQDGSVATADDIRTYQELATNVQNGATSYGTSMMAPGTATVADCRRVHDEYDAQVRPWVSEMGRMSGRMDDYMNGHEGASAADFACTSAMMMSEFDRHHAAACTFADFSANRTEAGRHVDAMLSYGGHMWDRCDQMMRGMDTGHSDFGPMMGGCQDWDRCCSGTMNGCCGGHDCCHE
jgi:hypothetical protein